MKLTKKAFRDWLKSKQEDEIVGFRLSGCGPLMFYLTISTGKPWDVDEVSAVSDDVEIPLPPWAAVFEDRIYNGDGDDGSDESVNSNHVTAWEALEALKP